MVACLCVCIIGVITIFSKSRTSDEDGLQDKEQMNGIYQSQDNEMESKPYTPMISSYGELTLDVDMAVNNGNNSFLEKNFNKKC